ncbi:MAG: 2-amino-4-hydroxy-6-hydroxymethyldihydropteridine diphosphokinase [Hyphomicrobiaceae bacterium]
MPKQGQQTLVVYIELQCFCCRIQIRTIDKQCDPFMLIKMHMIPLKPQAPPKRNAATFTDPTIDLRSAKSSRHLSPRDIYEGILNVTRASRPSQWYNSYAGKAKIWSIIGLGANISGQFGAPLDSLRECLNILAQEGMCTSINSSLYLTRPFDGPPQPRYYNAVAVIESDAPPSRLLRLLKSIEIQAGRRHGVRNGPRSLDLDLLDYRHRVIGWPAGRRRRHLVLPHPEMHRRRFVLEPLAEIGPCWRHPVFGLTAGQLLRRLPERRGEVERFLDRDWISCDKQAIEGNA